MLAHPPHIGRPRHRQHRSWLRLAGPTDSVMRTLELVGVDAPINCRETLHQALTD
ncbi:hypothetical protein ABZ467_38630 [Streptomyces sp. NPDC005727]|uniref:hypothetical protein n=1 Tax=Streptomyces sp. NPDC005727 TaxID=3157053 RepID=UPI0033FC1C94